MNTADSPRELAPGWLGVAIDPHHPWLVAFQGYTVLVTGDDGCMEGEGREGLYDYDTRVLSQYRITLDGRRPEYISGGLPESSLWMAHLRVPCEGGSPEGPRLPQDALGIHLCRRVGCGMEEVLTVTNHSMVPVRTELAIEVNADFADVQEVGGTRRQHGDLHLGWDEETRALTFDYHARRDGRELHRALGVRVVRSDSEVKCEERVFRFQVEIAPRGSWSAELHFASLVDGEWRAPQVGDRDIGAERSAEHRRWRRTRAHLVPSHPVIRPAFERAAEDIFALRQWEYDVAPDAWTLNAGVPTYTGVFGRDSLTAAWQSALLGPEAMRGTLARIAETQAEEESVWRDAEPGKMVHEIRRGPLSELNLIPQRCYYGTMTTAAMFILVLSEYWHWTGDEAALRRYRDAALRTFEWAHRYGDRDGDGLLEYVRRSPEGLKNHAWKDSDEAIRYADGRLVENPIATVEEQAFHLLALERMAEILVVLDEESRAGEFLHRARRLREQLNEAFWLEEEGVYAMALDPEKRPVRSIGSNMGHVLATGGAPFDRARRVADRLMEPDMFSGWGIRTLSTGHPSYNALAYHLGTVWPVENATFAVGFKRYGLDGHLDRLFSAIFAATSHFHNLRLPEAIGGHSRGESPVPSVYPNANSPQAWSASATIQLVQAMLGIFPFAPARALALVRPRLPEWLPELTLRNLRVGDATVSLRFRRQEDGSADHEVVERDGMLFVTTFPAPDVSAGLDQGWEDRFKEWALEHLPGRMGRALRIAWGDTEIGLGG